MSSSLLNNLVSYWKLEEASSTRADVLGTNNLTPAGTPGNVDGKILKGVDLNVSSSQSLGKASFSGLGAAPQFTFSGWGWMRSQPSVLDYTIMGLGGGSGNLDGVLIRVPSGMVWNVYFNGSGLTSTGPGTVNNKWYLVIFWFDGTNINLQINNGTVDSAAASWTVTPSDLGIGSRISGSASNSWDGIIDECGLWSRVLTETERGWLYNNSAGLTYPFDLPSKLLDPNVMRPGIFAPGIAR